MTVPVNDRRIQYTATASQTVFPYDFKIAVNTEITVLQTIKLTGVTNTLVLTTDYTVSNVGVAGGGDITLVTGAAVDDIITITGSTPLSRVTDFNQAGDFLMSNLNDQLDKLTDILQENTTEIDRSVKLATQDTTTSMTLPIATARASKFLAFDASGDAIAAAGTTEVPVSAFMETLLDDTTAAAARSTLGVTGTTINIGTLAGAADTYTATSTAAYTTYTAGDEFLFKVNVDNTGASTINVSSVGVKALEKFDGAGSATALEAGDIQADQYYKGVYNGTAVIVLNPEIPYLVATNMTGAPAFSAANMTSIPKTAGDTVQVVNTQTGAVATGTTTIPRDDSIPQNTEGDEYMTLAITPTNTNNKLLIEVEVFGSISVITSASMALFQDSTAGALKATNNQVDTATAGGIWTLSHYMTAGTTSATTFKVRLGPSSGTFTFNGASGGRLFGGVAASSITITEIQV